MLKRPIAILILLLAILSITPGTPSAAQDHSSPLPIQYGDSLNGELAGADSVVIYVFEGSEGDQITVELTSRDFDTYLFLTDSSENLLAENDDIDFDAGNLNSHIEYTLEANSQYFILVQGYAAGVYTLSLSNNSANQPPASPADGELNNSECDSLIQDALSRVANMCSGLGINEACYGHPSVSVTLANDNAIFEAQGDIVPLTDIESIITRPIDPTTNEWGLVVMNMQADLAENEGSVRLLVYGGVEVNEAVNQVVNNRPSCAATNTSAQNLNLYAGPDASFNTVDIFDRDSSLTINGRDESGEWLRSTRGWLKADSVSLQCEVTGLDVTTSQEDIYSAPMQAFTLRMDESARCQSAPSGMMVQTTGGQTANLMVNNVEIRLGSTAFLTLRSNRLTISNIQGNIQVTSGGTTRHLARGRQSYVEFDENGLPAGIPSEAEEFRDEVLHIEFEELAEVFEVDDWELDELEAMDECFGDDPPDFCIDFFFYDELPAECYEINPPDYCEELDFSLDEECYQDDAPDYCFDFFDDELPDECYEDNPPDHCFEDEFDEDDIFDDDLPEECYEDNPPDYCFDGEFEGNEFDEEELPDECYEDNPPDYCFEEEFEGEADDSDGDGILDIEDACPEEWGDQGDGCPTDGNTEDFEEDSDGDGISDDQDACPNEWGDGSDGCPADDLGSVDSDGDGISDDQDACPNEWGDGPDGCPADDLGSVDSDGDGISDDQDTCPNEWGDGPDGCLL